MTDVAVIGAGPAGAMAAGMLAQRGYRVRVLERQRFPRFSIGESLLAETLQLVDEAGMLEAVLSAGFQYKNGAVILRQDLTSEFNFAEKTSPGYGYTFQVPREQFDKVLADEAERMGAQVEYEVEVTAMTPGTAPQLTCRHKDGREEVIRPRYVLDGSGFGRTLPRLLDLNLPSSFPTRAAVFMHVRDRIEAGAFDRQKIRLYVHPEHWDVWFWMIPFSNGLTSLGVVGAPEVLARHKGEPRERLWKFIGEEPALKALLRNAEPTPRCGEIIGYAAAVKSLYGPGYALLGNAAEFLDPVFSSGVTIAMKSAHLAAGLIDREMRGETVDWEEEYEKPLMVGVETFRGFVSCWYEGTLQDVIFYGKKNPRIRRMICSVLAGYAWDEANPYVGVHAGRRIRALSAVLRQEMQDEMSGNRLPEDAASNAPSG